MKLLKIAKELGRRGGQARAKNLSAKQKRRIASMGGRAKYLSRMAIQRVDGNFDYLQVVRALRKPPRVKVVSRIQHPLPGIYVQAE